MKALHLLSPLFAALLAIGAASPALADDATPPNRYASTLVAAERFEVNGMLVERHGKTGAPMIFIPGLASGSWAWQDAARQFMPDHVVYVVTLPGFDGRPAQPGEPMANAQAALDALITSRKLIKPVLVGHSLGATLSIAYAEQHPASVGAVVALDGLPVFPGTEQMPLSARPGMADGIKARMAGATREAFVAQQGQYMRAVGVTDIGRADELAKLSARSDPDAVIAYMASTLALDLRADLPKITAPVLLISPYFSADAAQASLSETAKTDYYRGLMAGTARLTVVSVAPARHFAMFDQPQQVVDAIRNFLKTI
jgi:pimeloyl-ACP methyl ester carboxylesterase